MPCSHPPSAHASKATEAKLEAQIPGTTQTLLSGSKVQSFVGRKGVGE